MVLDPAKVRKHPAEWAEEEGIVIIEPLGWLRDGLSFDTPLTYEQYHVRALMSVLGPAAGTSVELMIESKQEQP